MNFHYRITVSVTGTFDQLHIPITTLLIFERITEFIFFVIPPLPQFTDTAADPVVLWKSKQDHHVSIIETLAKHCTLNLLITPNSREDLVEGLVCK